MSGVNDTGNSVCFDLRYLSSHQINVMHDVGRWSASSAPSATTTAASAPRRSGRQTIRRSSGGRGRREFRVEIRRQLHVLMEKRGATCKFLGCVVFQKRSDVRPLRKYRRLSK